MKHIIYLAILGLLAGCTGNESEQEQKTTENIDNTNQESEKPKEAKYNNVAMLEEDSYDEEEVYNAEETTGFASVVRYLKNNEIPPKDQYFKYLPPLTYSIKKGGEKLSRSCLMCLSYFGNHIFIMQESAETKGEIDQNYHAISYTAAGTPLQYIDLGNYVNDNFESHSVMIESGDFAINIYVEVKTKDTGDITTKMLHLIPSVDGVLKLDPGNESVPYYPEAYSDVSSTDVYGESLDSHIDKEKLVQQIKDWFNETESALNNFDKRTIQLTGSTEGGEMVVYEKEEIPVKIVMTYFGETGKAIRSYFFHETRLYFAFYQEYQYNMPIYDADFDANKSQVSEHRYYFHFGEMFRYTDPGKKKHSIGDSLFLEHNYTVKHHRNEITKHLDENYK